MRAAIFFEPEKVAATLMNICYCVIMLLLHFVANVYTM